MLGNEFELYDVEGAPSEVLGRTVEPEALRFLVMVIVVVGAEDIERGLEPAVGRGENGVFDEEGSRARLSVDEDEGSPPESETLLVVKDVCRERNDMVCVRLGQVG